MKKRAFTLAEVLVTLGIIGVVSAMTIPALTQNWQKKAYVTQLHKVYNVFQQGFMQAMNDKYAINLAEAGFYGGEYHSESEKNFLHTYFKVVKDCGSENQDCFASYKTGSSGYKSISGNKNGYRSGNHKVQIAGGAAVGLTFANDKAYIYVDTNGPKGPNIAGRDYFQMCGYSDGRIDICSISNSCAVNGTSCPGGSLNQARENYYNSYCKSNSYDNGCFGKILNDNWEMNY